MKCRKLVMVMVSLHVLLGFGFALAANDSNVNAATNQVKSGAKKISDGKIGEGVEDTAKGVGKTVSEGAKYSGEKVKEAGQAAESPAKAAAADVRGGAVGFGHSIKRFFTTLFSN
jgi:hypothetical protein